MMNSTPSRTGRRPGGSATREAILSAARDAFIERGFQKATIRGIAGAAAVDPALVMHFFGNKDTLFAEAMRPPFDPAAILEAAMATDPQQAGEVLARFFIEAWEAEPQRRTMLGLVRSAVTEGAATRMIREDLLGSVEAALAGLGRPQAGLRASLIGSQLIGLAMARHVAALPALVAVTREQLVAAVAPTIQRYITGDISGEAR